MRYFLLLLLTVFSKFSQSLDFGQLTFTTENYPPFNYQEAGKLTGISIDLLELVWLQLDQPSQPVSLMPWARAYHSLQHNPSLVLFAMAKTKAREGMFKWACPITQTRYVLLALKKDKVRIQSKSELKRYLIGTVRADISEQLLLENFYMVGNIISNVSIEPHLKRMAQGHLNLIAYEEHSVHNMLRRYGYSPDDFETVFTLQDSQTCFAFNPKVDAELYKEFTAALDIVTQSNEYLYLLEKYFPQKSAE